MGGFALLLLLGLALFWLSTVVYVAWGLTHPPRRTYASAVRRGLAGDPSELDEPRAFETWRVLLADGKKEAEVWSVEGDAPDGPTVVLSHGWGDSRIGGLVRLPAIAEWARRVVLFDYPGHGTTGSACRLGTREVRDLAAVIDRVRESEDAGAVVVYGWSMGAGVAVAAAQEMSEIAGVVAEAPYGLAWTPARNVMRMAGLPWRLNLRPALWWLGLWFGVGPGWRGFDRVALAGAVSAPVLAVHGVDDAICPVGDGRAIAEAAPRGTFAGIEGGGHNDLWTDEQFRAQVVTAVHAWLRTV